MKFKYSSLLLLCFFFMALFAGIAMPQELVIIPEAVPAEVVPKEDYKVVVTDEVPAPTVTPAASPVVYAQDPTECTVENGQTVCRTPVRSAVKAVAMTPAKLVQGVPDFLGSLGSSGCKCHQAAARQRSVSAPNFVTYTVGRKFPLSRYRYTVRSR